VTVEPLPLIRRCTRRSRRNTATVARCARYAEASEERQLSLVDALKGEIVEAIPEDDEEKRTLAKRAFERLREEFFRDDILNKRRRPDGRAFDQIRQITCEVGLLPPCMARRCLRAGDTSAGDADLGHERRYAAAGFAVEQDQFKRFMLHYNFRHSAWRSEVFARAWAPRLATARLRNALL